MFRMEPIKPFDFSNIPFVILFVILLIVIGFLTFLFISLFTSSKRDYQYVEKMKAESTTLRIFIIDVKNNSVVFFNRSDLRNKKEIDLNSFYTHFIPMMLIKSKRGFLRFAQTIKPLISI